MWGSKPVRRRSRERGVLLRYSLCPGRYSTDMPLDFSEEAQLQLYKTLFFYFLCMSLGSLHLDIQMLAALNLDY